jgi:hypothetical protein
MRVLKARAAGESRTAAAMQRTVTAAIIIIDISISNP